MWIEVNIGNTEKVPVNQSCLRHAEKEKLGDEMQKIQLSIVAAQYIWPVYIDPRGAARDMFAQRLMSQMGK